MGGGVYEAPYATLTIADPGATGLPAGDHEFRFSFDEEGEVKNFTCRTVTWRMLWLREWGWNPVPGRRWGVWM